MSAVFIGLEIWMTPDWTTKDSQILRVRCLGVLRRSSIDLTSCRSETQTVIYIFIHCSVLFQLALPMQLRMFLVMKIHTAVHSIYVRTSTKIMQSLYYMTSHPLHSNRKLYLFWVFHALAKTALGICNPPLNFSPLSHFQIAREETAKNLAAKPPEATAAATLGSFPNDDKWSEAAAAAGVTHNGLLSAQWFKVSTLSTVYKKRLVRRHYWKFLQKQFLFWKENLRNIGVQTHIETYV